ncbi:pilus assembly protein [Pseudomonas syringae]|nr:O-antigen ligase family protein [Pseudomonas syringae]MCF5029817.1 pilus assembly protein [Pseudomonas syringae]POD15918.1 pilus assembly protein [Pseudomonas syringae pv. syringae]UQB20967.1 O-antigen ligase family protein [Pseudomonas syringae pv. syringae]
MIFFIYCCAVLIISSCFYDFSGHDCQRVAQFFIGLSSLFMLLKYSAKQLSFYTVSPQVKLFLFSVVVMGVVSSLMSHRPLWALAELSVLLLSCGISYAFALQRTFYGVRLDQLFMGFVVLICSLKTTQFLGSAAAAFLSSAPILDTDLLLDGFSNKRFYGQFQTFTLPLLVLPLLLTSTRRLIKVGLFCLTSLWWMIAISGGTRGTWLGMAVAVTLMFCLGRAGRRWSGWQIAAATAGLLLFTLLFSVLPGLMGIEVSNFAGDRLTMSLSAREILWQQAWAMIKERPLLGFGPMHFADIWNAVAAHPHQAILQWACEWGIPSTLCVAGLALYGLSTTAVLVRKRAQSLEPVDMMRLCLFASLIGALTQSMVDGVIVMPYSQLWLAIIIGWLLALHEWQTAPRPASIALSRAWLLCLTLATGMMLYTIVRDLPDMDTRRQQFSEDFGGRYLPRFWMQGVIADPPAR